MAKNNNNHNHATKGFTRVDNRLLDNWLAELRGDSLKCILYLIRETEGWHKPKWVGTVGDVAEAINVPDDRAREALKRLSQEGLIKVTKMRGSDSLTFRTRFFMG